MICVEEYGRIFHFYGQIVWRFARTFRKRCRRRLAEYFGGLLINDACLDFQGSWMQWWCEGFYSQTSKFGSGFLIHDRTDRIEKRKQANSPFLLGNNLLQSSYKLWNLLYLSWCCWIGGCLQIEYPLILSHLLLIRTKRRQNYRKWRSIFLLFDRFFKLRTTVRMIFYRFGAHQRYSSPIWRC